MKKTWTALAIAGLAGTALVLPATAPASAAPTGKKHCVTNVSDETTSCYGTFRQAIASATSGRITDAPLNPADAVASKAFEKRINAITELNKAGATQLAVTLSIEYDWAYEQTNEGSVTYTADYGCDNTNDVDWQVNWVGDDWNDRISSFHNYSNCSNIHFAHVDFGTPSNGIYRSVGSMADTGGLNNQTSSIQWV
ncbi:hypothetical protein [Actinoplanes sp. NBRC 103695]|uniref:hypothetical protein n=1 Tax=Actinoplanes sp. NBRC 103695 TaxID=3032202 RepID=UPI0024A5BBFB|nr:hypothetical protein [Actinoplanes sp. NBRC 103695]GLZ01361.1 hypothetical protein Acsp02_86120 [Actinoplanes sp. NBRC 103695]